MKTLVLMGVSGSGKTTVGRLLAAAADAQFIDGDDYHSPENVRKMKAGIPLTDEDRRGWLAKLAALIRECDGRTVMACSALRESYRQVLAGADFVFLDGPPELLAARITRRSGHFMPADLLKSQLETLERPDRALVLDISASPRELVAQIRESVGW